MGGNVIEFPNSDDDEQIAADELDQDEVEKEAVRGRHPSASNRQSSIKNSGSDKEDEDSVDGSNESTED